MSNEKLVVYSYRRCPFAMRVRLTLNEKKIFFETVEEDLSNFSDKLRSLHPEAKVPVLVHGDWVLYESAIITEYIEEKFPDVRLMPSDPKERAEVRLWTYWCNHIFKPALDRFKYGTSRFSESECVGIESKLLTHLGKTEERLKKHTWLVGKEYSLADIHVFPFFRQLTKVNPTPAFLSQFPATLHWVQRVSERPAFKKTMDKN